MGLIYINDQPLTNFASAVVQERLGTMDQTCMAGFEKLKLEYKINSELLLDAPYTFTTPNDNFDDIEFTIALPNGLIRNKSDGGTDSAHFDWKVEIRIINGTWVTIFDSHITDETRDPIFKLYKVSDLGYTVVNGNQYELRLTRLDYESSTRFVSNSYLKSVREVVDQAFTRPGKALVGISAIATSKISGSIDVKVVREDRLINVWDGTEWTIEYSRNRAWVVYDILTQQNYKS